MVKQILVPLDGSALAEAALSHARYLAQQLGSRIVLLRIVVSPYSIAAPDLILAGYDASHDDFVRAAREYLETVAADLRSDGLSVSILTGEGPVAEAILEAAADAGVDMIVMSTHGRGGVSRWVYGSVADRVLQAATCPVLLVRTKEK